MNAFRRFINRNPIPIASLFCAFFIYHGVIIEYVKHLGVPSRATKILFIGNSLTATQNIPKQVKDISEKNGHEVYVEMLIRGGYGFREHAHYSPTQAAIAYGNWDYVVLQEQGQRFSFEPWQMKKEVFGPGRELVNSVHRYSPKARIVFYETFARKAGDPVNCHLIQELCSYEGMQHRVNENTKAFAAETHSLVAPVGEAWEAYQKAHPEIDLYEADGMHPSVAGAGLAAQVIAETIFPPR